MVRVRRAELSSASTTINAIVVVTSRGGEPQGRSRSPSSSSRPPTSYADEEAVFVAVWAEAHGGDETRGRRPSKNRLARSGAVQQGAMRRHPAHDLLGRAHERGIRGRHCPGSCRYSFGLRGAVVAMILGSVGASAPSEVVRCTDRGLGASTGAKLGAGDVLAPGDRRARTLLSGCYRTSSGVVRGRLPGVPVVSDGCTQLPESGKS